MVPAGEALHEIGSDGAAAAKRWLESTTRAEVWWVRPNPTADERLSFPTVSGSTFSGDIGGILQGGDIHGKEFLGEVKKYKNSSDQGTEFRKFLAKCYRAFEHRPERCGNLFWITWAPFSAQTWAKIDDQDNVKAAVLEHWKYNFTSANEAVTEAVDMEKVSEVSDRVWRIVLSDYQVEHLSMSNDYRSIIVQHEVKRGRM